MSERMLHTDAFAWYMESDPALRSTVVAMGLLESTPDWDYLKARIDRASRLVPKFRMRVQEPPLRLGPPVWTPDETFDIDFHVRRVTASPPADIATLLEMCRVAAMTGFDHTRPLWELTLVEGLSGGRAGIVMKLHHALTDGIGGVQILGMCVDPTAEMPPLEMPPVVLSGGRMSTFALTRDAVGASAVEAARNGWRLLRGGLPTFGMAGSVGRIIKPINKALSPTLGERTLARRLDVLEMPFEQLHAAGHRAGGSVNDAFLAAVTGGLRRYHELHGAAVDELHVTLPISLREADDDIGSNRIGLVRFPLPVGVADPAERIRAIRPIVRRWRDEPALGHIQGIAAAMNLMPRSYLQGIFKRVEFVASDVPGMPEPVYAAGARVLGYYPFGPTIGAALNATLMSYAGTCCVGFTIDTTAVPDSDELVRCLHEGFDEVVSLATPVRRSRRVAAAGARA